MAVGASLLVAIAGVLSTVTLSAERVQSRAAAERDLEVLAQRIVERIGDELRTAHADGFMPPPFAPLGSSSLDYELNEGWVGGAIQWSLPRSLALRPAPEDPGYGNDSDGDGRADPGRLVWTSVNDDGEPMQAIWVEGVSEMAASELANGVDDDGNGWIDERGLSFELDGVTLRIRLSLERTLEGGVLLQRSAETAIGLAN
jgi:hypothetical protein